MPNSITTAFVQQFKDNVRELYQQKGSRLRPLVMEEELTGELKFFERIGPVTAVLKTGRHSPTPILDVDHSRRAVMAADYEWATLIDREDLLRTLIDPQSNYVRLAAMALGRAMDDMIVTELLGSAKTGKKGDVLVALPASQLIANGGTNLTVAKLRSAKLRLDEEEVPEEGRHWAITAAGLSALLEQTEITSTDFASVKALVMGDVDTFLGFSFVRLERLPKVGNIHSSIVWQKDAFAIAVPQDITTRIDERVDLSMVHQVFAKASFGGVRMEEFGVLQVDYDVTA